MNAQIKWLIGAVIALVIINIALVAFVWLRKDSATVQSQSERPRDAREFLIKTLSLNEQQTKAFDSLRDEHFQRMNDYQKKMRFAKDELFKLLSTNETVQEKNVIINSLKTKIGELQGAIDTETFDHFSRLRSLLSEEQKKSFDNTIQEVLRTMAPRNGNGPPPGNRPDGDRPPPNGDRPPQNGERPPPPEN